MSKIRKLEESPSENKDGGHMFWNTQPVPKSDSDMVQNDPIDCEKTPDSISREPLRLPDNYYWDTFDINEEEQLEEIFELLRDQYIEDSDHTFRFKYSKPFLSWGLKPPGYKKEWHLCVRTKPKNRMVACITAIPATLFVLEKKISVVEINFLCVHKSLRSKRLTPVLITEITRRVNLCDVWQAIYTAGVELSRPLTKATYYHRQIDPRKLVEVKFCSSHPCLKPKSVQQLYSLPEELDMALRPLAPPDVAAASELLRSYLARFKLRLDFSDEEFAHWFLPRDGVVSSFVAQDAASGAVTDLVSFYELSSSVLANAKHSELKAAYCFYNVATSVPLERLIHNALILAKKQKFDVMNALNLMENGTFFESLRFKPGDGLLHYYMYNWRMAPLQPNEISVVVF